MPPTFAKATADTQQNRMNLIPSILSSSLTNEVVITGFRRENNSGVISCKHGLILFLFARQPPPACFYEVHIYVNI